MIGRLVQREAPGAGGWRLRIPGYSFLPHGGLCDTILYYRNLGGALPPGY